MNVFRGKLNMTLVNILSNNKENMGQDIQEWAK